jgi:hypothetical protein
MPNHGKKKKAAKNASTKPKVHYTEDQMQAALQYLYLRVPDADGKLTPSVRSVAIERKLPAASLQARFNGTHKDRRAAHEKQQSLTKAEETVLAEWTKKLARRGVPLTRETLRQKASQISKRYIGVHWTYQFLKRNPTLTTRWTVGLESCRAQALNRPTTEEFYDIYESVCKETGAPKENRYNMDEKGVELGDGDRVKAFVDRDQKTAYQVGDGNRELVTMIETVCADGSYCPTTAIFKGKRFNAEWGKDNPSEARFVLYLIHLLHSSELM